MENIELDHMASLSGSGLYSYIANSHHSKPFHDSIEKTIKNSIGDWKNVEMDAVAGKWHRWKHGHDILDVRGANEIGHLMTDFFTKDGFAFLPGMSKEYLGNFIVSVLKSFGVTNPIKWLNMNGFDHIFGWVSMVESGHDISQAISSEQIDFTWETAFDTFGEGTIEIAFGLETFNPVLLTSGVTEYAAGSITLYKDISRDNALIYEKIIDNLPNQGQIVSALGFYMLLASLKNYVAYSNGKINIQEFRNKTFTDVSISLGTFVITKSLITTIALGSVTGGMLLPLLIGGGTSLLLKESFSLAFPNNKILITENELWCKSPIQYHSPWTSDIHNNEHELCQQRSFEYDSLWSQNVFDNGNDLWQKDFSKDWKK
jgi:hypothetical protein